MIKVVGSGSRSGDVTVPASKSYAHRHLICSALSDSISELRCIGISKDIQATIDCLGALGAKIDVHDEIITVHPISNVPSGTTNLNCGESGSTLRFLLPVIGVLGVRADIKMEGKLPSRPHKSLTDELSRHGMTITQNDDIMHCSGKLTSGTYRIPGNVSSQFISGLLMALPLLEEDSVINIDGIVESADYISMTEEVISEHGIAFSKASTEYFIRGHQRYKHNGLISIERDWSNAAFFVCMGALSRKGITLHGLDISSKQGDKAIMDIVTGFGAEVTVHSESIHIKRGKLCGQIINASRIPDLIPAISALAACASEKTLITNAERLRFKESDRLKTTTAMLKSIGAEITETDDGLIINGRDHLDGGIIDPANDHRIAMAGAIAASKCTNDVKILDAECTAKSYPSFWDDLNDLEVEE